MGFGLIGALGGLGKGLSDTAERNFNEEKEARIREWEMKKLMTAHDLDMQKVKATQDFQSGENEKSRTFQSGENQRTRDFQSGESSKTRAHAEDMAYLNSDLRMDEAAFKTDQDLLLAEEQRAKVMDAAAAAKANGTTVENELLAMGEVDLAKTHREARTAGNSKGTWVDLRDAKGRFLGQRNNVTGEVKFSQPDRLIDVNGNPMTVTEVFKLAQNPYTGEINKQTLGEFGISLGPGIGSPTSPNAATYPVGTIRTDRATGTKTIFDGKDWKPYKIQDEDIGQPK